MTMMSRGVLGHIAGLSPSTLNYWVRKGVLIPVSEGGGKGNHHRFPASEATIARLLPAEFGMNVRSLRLLASALREQLPQIAKEVRCIFVTRNEGTHYTIHVEPPLTCSFLVLKLGWPIDLTAKPGAKNLPEDDNEPKRVSIAFRTTQTLRSKIAESAAKSGRSLSQEVEHRLELTLQADEAVSSVTPGGNSRRLTPIGSCS